jgi:PAS domain S-box-containing protein
MSNALRPRPRNIYQALWWLLAAVMVPLLLGALALLVVQSRQEEQLARNHLQTLAQTLVQAVDREFNYGRGQLEVLAASPAVDAIDWQELQRFSSLVAARRPGSYIVLVRPDGQLLLNTAVTWGQPLANIWAHNDEDREVLWEGRRLPLRWRKISRQVFDGRSVYSDLYFGGTSQAPTLALSVPVARQGQVRYGLTLVFPPAILEALIQSSVDTMGMRALVVDRRGLVVASNAASTARMGDTVPPIAAAQDLRSGHYEITAPDDTRVRGAYAVSPTNGFVVRVELPVSQVFSPVGITSAGWVALVLASLSASVILAGLIGRQMARPLRELAQSARLGQQPPAERRPTGIAEIDELSHALVMGAEAERQRAHEHLLRLVAQQQKALVTERDERRKRVLDQLFVFVCVLDLDGTLRQCNSAPLEQAGITSAEVTGRLFWECHWWLHEDAEVERVRGAAERAARGETVRFDTVARFSGPQLQMVDLQLAPLRDVDGRVTHLIASGVNVQERVSAMRELRQSEARADASRRLLEATLEAAPVGITVTDPQGLILHVNRAGAELSRIGSASNRSLAVLSEEDCTSIDPARALPLAPDEWPLQQALRKQLAVTRIVDIRSTDPVSEHATVLMSAAPVLDAAGKVMGGVMVEVDITKRIKAEAALRRADRQKDEFLATLSHELRNPLGPIRNAAALIRLSSPADPRVQRAQVIIERQVSHLARLVDDLLDVSRMSVGKIALRQETLDLGAIAASAVESVRTSAEAAHLTLEHEIHEPHALVDGDATRLLQCMLNLLSNAVKFTPRGGRILTRVIREEQLAVFEVQDSGDGISPANLDRIFELFAQEHPSGFDGNSGLGIGLALTRKLVQLHGGSVKAFSAGPGQGSTFRIELPAVTASAAEQPLIAVIANGSGARVLVVDDNCDAADTLGEFLTMRGFSATSVYSAADALRVVKQNAHDAVLLDIGLPDMNGYEVCRRIREAELPKQPLLIALTGWGHEKDREHAKAVGFNAHLTKPADPDEIIALVKQLMQSDSPESVSSLQRFSIAIKKPTRANSASLPVPPEHPPSAEWRGSSDA